MKRKACACGRETKLIKLSTWPPEREVCCLVCVQQWIARDGEERRLQRG